MDGERFFCKEFYCCVFIVVFKQALAINRGQAWST